MFLFKRPTMVTSSEPLVLNAIGEHTATVIIVHGLAESCHTWAKHVEHWRLNGTMDHVKFILPDAPVRPLTVVRIHLSISER